MKKKMFDAFFINVIPQKESLEIIIGYPLLSRLEIIGAEKARI